MNGYRCVMEVGWTGDAESNYSAAWTVATAVSDLHAALLGQNVEAVTVALTFEERE